MVGKGLTVGAVFEDGGLYYEVQTVLPNGNYISRRIDKNVDQPDEPEETEVVEATEEPKKRAGRRKKE